MNIYKIKTLLYTDIAVPSKFYGRAQISKDRLPAPKI